ncbi:CAP domain-containing protein [Russula emetica]|nr:CAP domain-containing protein [Russula emetica]
MPSLLFVAFVAIASLQGTFGAPSCAHGSNNLGSCVSKCKAKMGMGNHTWGPSSSYSTPSSAVPTPSSGSTPAANLEDSTSTTQPTPSSTPSAASSSNPASSTPGTSDGSVSSADIQAYLSAHNTVRAQHGAASLTWNDTLSSVAQAWANGCKFQHSGGQFGENLAAGTGGAYTITTAVQSWTDEVSQYDPNSPVPSHFTQVVWKATTQVGCAHQDCSGIFDASYGLAHYHVCEYSPPGNVIGEFAQNVQV